jgi:hypothetical protein
LALVLTLALAVSTQTGAEEPSVQALLQRLTQVADAYRENALKFSCEETIKWSGRGSGNSLARTAGRERFGYVFIHDQDEGYTDYRTRLKRGSGKKVPRRVTPEEFNVPRYLGSAYLWIFTFKGDRWPHYEYDLVGEETVLDRLAFKLVFKPVLPIEAGVNDWYGTAWIDAEIAQLLKVEAYTPEDRARQRKMQRHASGDAVNAWIYDIESVTTWFEIEVNGLRFPSRVEIRRFNYNVEPSKGGWKIRPDPLLQVDQSYQRYQFFGVSTREELGPGGES